MTRATNGMPPRAAIPKPLQPLIFYRRPAQTLDWCRRRHGDTFMLWIPPWGDVVVFTNPADVKEVFAHDSQDGGLDGGRAYRPIFDMLMGRHSMFAVEGAEHLRLRRLLMRAFRGQAIEAHREPIEEIAATEVDRWPVGERMKFEHAIQQLTLAVVIRDVFGVTDADHEQALRRLLPKVVNAGTLIQLEIAFPSLRRFGPARRHHRVMAETRAVLAELVARRRAATDLDERIDILTLLVRTPDDEGHLLTDAELVDFLMTLLLAGHETTAAEMSWTVELLMRNPERRARLVADLGAGREEYLDAVIREALRLHPALPYISRGVLRDVEIGGWKLPAGATVGVGISAAHHIPEVFEDPLEFRPERFLEAAASGQQGWIPWGGGRRRCAGQHFATVEMQATLGTLFRRVELEPARRQPERSVGKAVTMVPQRGTEVVVTRRLAPLGAPPRPAEPSVAGAGQEAAR